MKRGSNRKGLSTIVSTLLILLLVFVAIGILWVVVRNVIQSGSEQVSLGKFTLDLAIDQVQIQQDINQVTVKVERKPGQGEFTGLKFIVSDGNNQETFDSNVTLLEDEKQYYRFTLASINVSNIQKIEIVPIFTLSSGKTSLGDVKATWTKETADSSGNGIVVIGNSNNNVDNSNIGLSCTSDLNCTADYNSTNFCSGNSIFKTFNDYSCDLTINKCVVSTSQIKVLDCNSATQTCPINSCVDKSTQTTVSNAKIVGITTSFNDGNYKPENTLDGNLDAESRWSAEGDGQWITYELNQSTQINYVRIAFFGDTSRYFDLQYSTDGTNWMDTSQMDVTSSPNMASAYQTFTFSPAVNAKYIRYTGHGSSAPSLWNSIVEMDINGFSVGTISTVPITVTNQCTNGQTQSCTISNGAGQQTCSSGSWGSCTVVSCNSGYTQSGNSCVADNNGGTINAAGGLNEGKCDSNTGAVIVWSENWDSATKADNWPYYSFGWWNHDYTTLASSSGHGNVLKVTFPSGTVGSESGFGNYRIPFDSTYKELYLSFDYYIPGDFDYGYADGKGGGKFFASLTGGSMVVIPHRDNPNYDQGWAGIFLFQEDRYTEYNYFWNHDWFYDSNVDAYWPSGSVMTSLVKNQWHKITLRIVVSDPGKENGIFEVFDNSKMIYQKTGIKFNSDSNQEYMIDDIYLNSFFGGSGRDYQSPKTQYMEFDNLEAFYYPKGSSDYRSGPSEAGRTIQVPNAISYHPDPPNKFTETKYTEKSGTMVSHCGFAIPVGHTDDFQTSTIEVQGATQLNLNVKSFVYDSGVGYEGYKQILKIYQGTGSNKKLVRTFENGQTTYTPDSFTIQGNSATIEWQAGQGNHIGFQIDYSSNGVGSGSNFKCNSGYVVAEEYNNLASC